MTDRVGQQFGNYQLIQLLGQGSSAEVYLGKHRYLNSYAALKVLHATLYPGDEHTFLAEAQTLVGLRHPNIIHLLDFGIENGTPVLIMDYAPKGSLRQYYPHGTHLPLATVVDFVAQVATALQYAHNHHVIHRDVKPGNILLDADNRLLLSDFGISLLTPPAQRLSTRDLAGTPNYIAPEQLRNKPCFASDQYALAIIVYEWLCGELPFRGNMWEISHQHMYTAPPPLRTRRPELPLELEKVVLRALTKKPQDRFVSMQAFALALARASQISLPVDENASQVTTPLQTIPRASLTSHSPFVFLSYARKDFNLAKSLTDNMTAQGVAGWFDHQTSSLGISEEARLREAIRNASAVILIATPHTRRSLPLRNRKFRLSLASCPSEKGSRLQQSHVTPTKGCRLSVKRMLKISLGEIA
jgi:serine/threonine protein kinase